METTNRSCHSHAPLTAQLLGRPQLTWQGEPLALTAQKPLALVYLLAVRREAIPREELVELLWGAGKRGNLRSALYTLRKDANADAWLGSHESRDELCIRVESDLDRFERLLERGENRAALSLWRAARRPAGSRTMLLQDFSLPSAPAFHDWLESERARLSTLYLDCVSRRATELEDEREYLGALELLRELVYEDPLNEDAHRRIMELEWRRGEPRAALEQFQICRRVLAEELGLEPLSTTVALFESIQQGASRQPRSEVTGGHARSALTFVGRQRELNALDDVLFGHRVVTLLGPGGVGKTRLAREAMQRTSFAGERVSYFVPLGVLRSSKFIVPAIANAMQLSFTGPEDPRDQLCRALRERPALLVLDNVEHLPEAGDVIDDLLSMVPELAVLMTSRRRLGLSAEHGFTVEGLEFPRDARDPDGARLDAVRLFVAAAHRTDGAFSLSHENRAAVFRICRLLRGHPLGLELAAGWLRLHGAGELADALHEDLLQLENPGLPLAEHHASLRTVMERSWALLSDREQRVLAGLSVCRGGFDLPAARAVADGDLSTLVSLVGHSLLQSSPSGRFDLHPLVHEFGQEKLRSLSVSRAARERHARFFLERLGSHHERILGETPGPALDAIERDFENVREAWLHASRLGWDEELLAAVDALSLFADMRVRFHEAIELFGAAAEALDGDSDAQRRARAVLLGEKGAHLYRLCRYEDVLSLTRSLSESSRSSVDGNVLRAVLKLEGSALYGMGRYAEARPIFQRHLALVQEQAPQQVSRALRSLANVEACMGLYAAAEDRYREAIALDRMNGYLIGIAINLNNLAEVLVLVDRLAEAETVIDESLSYAEGVDIHLVPYLDLNRAQLAFRRGDLSRAAERARACREKAELYGQVALRSRSATLLGKTELRRGELASASRWLVEAVEIAFGAHEAASLVYAFAAVGELALAEGNEKRACAYLDCAARHPAGEHSVRSEAQRLLGSLGVSGPGGPMVSVEELVAMLAAVRRARLQSGVPAAR